MASSQKFLSLEASASAHADERAPAGGQPCAYQHKQRIVAERAAVLAHCDTERADLVTVCRIEQARKNREHGSNEIHRTPPCAPTGRRHCHPASNDLGFDVASAT